MIARLLSQALAAARRWLAEDEAMHRAADLALDPYAPQRAAVLRDMEDATARVRALAAVNRPTALPAEAALLRARRAAIRPTNPRHN